MRLTSVRTGAVSEAVQMWGKIAQRSEAAQFIVLVTTVN
jgi:hypothetical protein